MADDLVPSSSGWATTSMKPAPDEEINAVWGRNAIDNTGYLFHRLGDGYKLVTTNSDLLTVTGGKTFDYRNPFYHQSGAENLLWYAGYVSSPAGGGGDGTWTFGILFGGVGTAIFTKGLGSSGSLITGSVSTVTWGTGWYVGTSTVSISNYASGTSYHGITLYFSP